MTTWWRKTLIAVALPVAACGGGASDEQVATEETSGLEVSTATEASVEPVGPALPTAATKLGHREQREIYTSLLAGAESYLAGISGRTEFSALAAPEVLDRIDTLAPDGRNNHGIVLEPDVQSTSEDAGGVDLVDCLTIETREARGQSTRFEQQQVRLEPSDTDAGWVVTSIEVLTPADGPPDCVPNDLASLMETKVDRYLQAANRARNNPRFAFDGSQLDATVAGAARSGWLSTLHQLVATNTNYEIDEESQIEVVGFAPSTGEAVLAVRACRRWIGEAAVVSNGERRPMSELEESGLVAAEMVEDLLVWATGPERGKVFELLGQQPVAECWTTTEGDSRERID